MKISYEHIGTSRFVWMKLQASAFVCPLELVSIFHCGEVTADAQNEVEIRLAPLRNFA